MEYIPTSLSLSHASRYFPPHSDASRCITMHSLHPIATRYIPLPPLFYGVQSAPLHSASLHSIPMHFIASLRNPSLPIAIRSASIAARDRCYERRAAVLFVGAGGWQVAHEWRYFLKSRPGCQSLSKYGMRVGNLLAAERRREGDIGVPARGGILVRAALGVSLC